MLRVMARFQADLLLPRGGDLLAVAEIAWAPPPGFFKWNQSPLAVDVSIGDATKDAGDVSKHATRD